MVPQVRMTATCVSRYWWDAHGAMSALQMAPPRPWRGRTWRGLGRHPQPAQRSVPPHAHCSACRACWHLGACIPHGSLSQSVEGGEAWLSLLPFHEGTPTRCAGERGRRPVPLSQSSWDLEPPAPAAEVGEPASVVVVRLHLPLTPAPSHRERSGRTEVRPRGAGTNLPP